MSEAGGLYHSAAAPVGPAVLQREHGQPVRDQDEGEQRHRQRQHEGGDLHADRPFDLLAHLDGQCLPEQLHPPAGHTRRRHLGLQHERQRDDDDGRDGGREDGVAVERHAQPLEHHGVVPPHVDGGAAASLGALSGENDLIHLCQLNPSIPCRRYRECLGRPVRLCGSSSAPEGWWTTPAVPGRSPIRTGRRSRRAL